MPRHKHGYYIVTPTPKLSRSWANRQDDRMNRKGWVAQDNERYRMMLRAERLLRETEGGKVNRIDGVNLPTARCRPCRIDNHEYCYRVVCYCPCYWLEGQKKIEDISDKGVKA